MVAVDHTKAEEADAPDDPIESSLTATPVTGPEPGTQEGCSSIPGKELKDAQDETLENEPGENDAKVAPAMRLSRNSRPSAYLNTIREC